MITIAQAKLKLTENFENGMDCPCCGQFVKQYKYNLFATSACALIDLYKLPRDYHHVSQFAEARKGKARASHFAELRFWGLAEPMDSKTATTNSSGMWRITKDGELFVQNKYHVRKLVLVFNNKFFGFEGRFINIKDALGNKFDYNELMNG